MKALSESSNTIIRFGLGLIGIGKPWGYVPNEIPDETDIQELLNAALHLGVRYFDTAPSYGRSEQHLGQFLSTLRPSQRAELTIATKMGEHWNATEQNPYLDHTLEALRASLDNSMRLLGRIDILQLHKTTPVVLRSNALQKAWEHASTLGIKNFGASVSDLESASMVLREGTYQVIQLPYNYASPKFESVIQSATAAGKMIAVNRPFAMGRLMHESETSPDDAFRFILRQMFNGVVLSGTTKLQHLKDNYESFLRAATSLHISSA